MPASISGSRALIVWGVTTPEPVLIERPGEAVLLGDHALGHRQEALEPELLVDHALRHRHPGVRSGRTHRKPEFRTEKAVQHQCHEEQYGDNQDYSHCGCPSDSECAKCLTR